jgi:protein-tyrosine kinase
MERLQAAIEKARAQRDSLQAEQPVAAQPGRAGSVPVPAAGEDLAARWHAVRPLDGKVLRAANQQIVTLRTGPTTAPFDILRTRIAQQARVNNWKRIAVVSPHSGCGKTLTVANLAFSFGRQAEMRTVVIDFDLRRGTLARTLHQTPGHTMGDVIEGRVSFAEHALRHDENVLFGLNGGPVANPSELLQSTATRDMLAAIEATWQPDLLLFDVPPLRATDDSIGFLRNVDAAVIVVAAGETPMGQIDVAERQVADLTNVMGVVLNKCRIMDGEYGYEDYGV